MKKILLLAAAIIAACAMQAQNADELRPMGHFAG